MLRIYYPIPDIREDQFSITGEQARYLASVLRCRQGERIAVFDGKGNCLEGTIEKAGKKEVFVRGIRHIRIDTESILHITLVQSILKGEKMDIVIQKTTELGVKEIFPAVSERSQPRDTKKVGRWRKVAEEASKQSGRSTVPLIHDSRPLQEIFSGEAISRGFLFYEGEGRKISDALMSYSRKDSQLFSGKEASDASDALFIFIGPEGGFTREEVALGKEKGLIVSSLGKRILRAETAAISAVTLVQFALGDMG
jgi:16S rRNA (uracil1498-N3)-methyltransferase